MAAIAKRQYEIFADYFQFYLRDHGEAPDAPTDYVPADNQVRIKVAPHIIVVLPERNMTVPVDIEVLETEPPLDPEAWDHIVEASIDVPSGRIEIHECTGGSIDILPVGMGTFRTRVCFSGLDTLSDDGLDGDDRYSVALWPAPFAPLSLIKPYEEER